MKLTDEQKARMEPAIRRAYDYVAADACCRRVSQAVEVACDADRPVTLGKMSPEDYRALGEAYADEDTQAWLREVLRDFRE